MIHLAFQSAQIQLAAGNGERRARAPQAGGIRGFHGDTQRGQRAHQVGGQLHAGIAAQRVDGGRRECGRRQQRGHDQDETTESKRFHEGFL
ncbi:hypothetical protein [Pseudoxanthomonas mexicana]